MSPRHPRNSLILYYDLFQLALHLDKKDKKVIVSISCLGTELDFCLPIYLLPNMVRGHGFYNLHGETF